MPEATSERGTNVIQYEMICLSLTIENDDIWPNRMYTVFAAIINKQIWLQSVTCGSTQCSNQESRHTHWMHVYLAGLLPNQVMEREREYRGKKLEIVRMCVCEWEREREKRLYVQIDCECVCVCERERENGEKKLHCSCVCVWVRDMCR